MAVETIALITPPDDSTVYTCTMTDTDPEATSVYLNCRMSKGVLASKVLYLVNDGSEYNMYSAMLDQGALTHPTPVPQIPVSKGAVGLTLLNSQIAELVHTNDIYNLILKILRNGIPFVQKSYQIHAACASLIGSFGDAVYVYIETPSDRFISTFSATATSTNTLPGRLTRTTATPGGIVLSGENFVTLITKAGVRTAKIGRRDKDTLAEGEGSAVAEGVLCVPVVGAGGSLVDYAVVSGGRLGVAHDGVIKMDYVVGGDMVYGIKTQGQDYYSIVTKKGLATLRKDALLPLPAAAQLQALNPLSAMQSLINAKLATTPAHAPAPVSASAPGLTPGLAPGLASAMPLPRNDILDNPYTFGFSSPFENSLQSPFDGLSSLIPTPTPAPAAAPAPAPAPKPAPAMSIAPAPKPEPVNVPTPVPVPVPRPAPRAPAPVKVAPAKTSATPVSKSRVCSRSPSPFCLDSSSDEYSDDVFRPLTPPPAPAPAPAPTSVPAPVPALPKKPTKKAKRAREVVAALRTEDLLSHMYTQKLHPVDHAMAEVLLSDDARNYIDQQVKAAEKRLADKIDSRFDEIMRLIEGRE